MTGVTVHTMDRPRSPASETALRQRPPHAFRAISEVAISGSAMCRSLIPTRRQDPFVVGVHHLFQIVVGQDPRGGT